MTREIVLASASPRRKEILENLGVRITVVPGSLKEERRDGEAPASYALRMAMQKALAVAKDRKDGIVIGADTIVLLDGRILGKPQNAEDAKKMLKALSGREHIVITGIGIVDVDNQNTMSGEEQTIVYFRRISDEEIERYVATGEPLDKAGGYGIQGKGGFFIRRIEGDYFNVVGLPVSLLYELLQDAKIDLL